MGPEVYVLDTSALLTLIEDEAGAERVERVIRQGNAQLLWVSLLEVSYITQQERGLAEAEHRYALLKSMPVRITWEMDEPLVLLAGRLKATRRLSLADTLIAAFAIRLGAVLLHKDPEYEILEGQVRLEALPYKRSHEHR